MQIHDKIVGIKKHEFTVSISPEIEDITSETKAHCIVKESQIHR